MLDMLYPPRERHLFVDRLEILAQLEAAAEQLIQGQPPINLALFGPRRRGKTAVLKEFLAHLRARSEFAEGRLGAIYINLEPLASTAWLLATQYIGWCVYWLTAPADAWPDDYLTWPGLLRAPTPSPVHQLLLDLHARFEQRDTSPSYLLTTAFQFPARLTELLQRPLVVILDEFPFLRRLESQRDTGNIVSLFRQALGAGPVGYVLAGSHVSAMRWLVQEGQSPLFGQLTALTLGPLPREDARLLAQRLLPRANFAVWHRIATLGADQPYYIQALCNRLTLWRATGNGEVDLSTVDAAFYTELAEGQGSIHLHCQYMMDISLEQARYHALLRGLLEALAADGPQTIAELRATRFSSHSANNLRTYLLELVDHGLVKRAEEGNRQTYAITDPVLAQWINVQRLGLAITEPERPAQSDTAALRERLMRVSAELALAKEAEVRDLLRRLQGRTVPGELLGTPEPVTIPHFATIEPYLSTDGQVELDALAQGDQVWAVEVRWQVGAASRADLERFVAKRAGVPIIRYWFISRGGFRPQAVDYAHTVGVYLTDHEGYLRLWELAGQ